LSRQMPQVGWADSKEIQRPARPVSCLGD